MSSTPDTAMEAKVERAVDAAKKADAAGLVALSALGAYHRTWSREERDAKWGEWIARRDEYREALWVRDRAASDAGGTLQPGRFNEGCREWQLIPGRAKTARKRRGLTIDPEYDSGAAAAHALRSFVGTFASRADVRVKKLAVAPPARKAVLARARADERNAFGAGRIRVRDGRDRARVARSQRTAPRR